MNQVKLFLYVVFILGALGCVPDKVLTVSGGASNVISFEKAGNVVTSVTIYENTAISDVKIVINGAQDAASNYQFSIHSDNQTLLPDSNIVLSGTDKFRNLTITPVTGKTGTALMTGTIINTATNQQITGSLTLIVAAVPVVRRPLNDSGQTSCSDYAFTDSGTTNDVTGSGTHNSVTCSVLGVTQTMDGVETTNGLDIVRAGQDAVYGRDVTHNDNSDGHAGFSFTKLDANGSPLAANAASWSCVKDNVTGLVWESKTNDNGLRDKDNTYTWYNSTGINDAGNPGNGDTGVGTIERHVIATNPTGSDACYNQARCDTEKYTADVNATGLCGFTDWRMPAKSELFSLVNQNASNPRIDSTFFPENIFHYYWTSSPTPNMNSGDNAFVVIFNNGGDIGSVFKSGAYAVRLVHSSKVAAMGSGCTLNRDPDITITKPDAIYVNHGNGTVTDQQTGLMWQQCVLGLSGTGCATGTAEQHTWQSALKVANDNAVSGYTDWRLPNIKELDSLVESACSNPSINNNLFPNTPYSGANTWSSTNLPGTTPKNVQVVGFSDGFSTFREKNSIYSRYVRLVRTGQ